MTSEVEIGVWVEGVQKWVTGVTRRTTCHDVIKALLRAQHTRAEDSDVMHYVIVERWRKVERPLDHEQRILKVWRTWGEAVGEVRFSLRRVRDENVTAPTTTAGGTSGRPERSRRRQKLRHAHSSRETLHPKKLARDDPKFSETMERLMRLVVAQGETIQTQLRRLQERENQIEQYEQQMHLLRVQNLGTDYLLHSYLKDEQGESKDEPGSEEKSNDSGVVTEEVGESALSQTLGITAEEEAATASSLEEIEEILSILARIEEINKRLVHEEEALSGMSTAVQAAHEQHRDESELLQEELALVAHTHAQLVSDARQNEQRLRESEAVLMHQRRQLDLLLLEDTESDLETRALREHLDYIIHLPPSAFRLPEDSGTSTKVPTASSTITTTDSIERTTTKYTCNTTQPAQVPPPPSTIRSTNTKNMEIDDSEIPPPLPTCPPPIVEENREDDDVDSAKNSSLCVSSRSSTSSEASTSSSTSGLGSKTPSTSTANKSSSSSSSSLPSSSKTNEGGGKDTDSTDSNSDTGLSSLHSSSDEGVYVLDTLV